MTTDLDKLIEEAQTYNPRAQSCWPWWHAWAMWGSVNVHQQSRRCVRCGLEQRRALAHACTVIGMVYYQHCNGCGEHRRLECGQ